MSAAVTAPAQARRIAELRAQVQALDETPSTRAYVEIQRAKAPFLLEIEALEREQIRAEELEQADRAGYGAEQREYWRLNEVEIPAINTQLQARPYDLALGEQRLALFEAASAAQLALDRAIEAARARAVEAPPATEPVTPAANRKGGTSR